MNVGISFTLLSVIYNLILNIIYLRKERIKSIENTLYVLTILVIYDYSLYVAFDTMHKFQYNVFPFFYLCHCE